MEIPIPHTRQVDQVDEIHTSRSNSLTAILLFLVSPFAALLVALKRYKANWAKNVVWFFVVFYGFNFVIISDGVDASRYREKFEDYANTNITFLNFTTFLYADDTNYVDVVENITSFLISRFTDNYRYLFAGYGLIFGYFYSRNIWYLIEKSESYLKRENIPIIITFALVLGFWAINGFRMWTAAHVFFFGAIQYLIDDRKKGIAIAALSILFHFSYILPVAMLIGFSLLRNRINLYFIFFISSFFISELDITFVRETLLAVLPEVFHGRVNSYAGDAVYENWLEKDRSELAFYIVYYQRMLRWLVIGLLSIIYLKGYNYIKENKSMMAILGFSFLFFGVGNIAGLIPSGGRFITVATLFAVAAIYYYLEKGPEIKIIKRFELVIWLVMAFYWVVAIRVSFDSIGILTILGNPFIALFGNIDMPLIEILK